MNTLKLWREQNRLTQEELARRSGVSRATISALETGRARYTTTSTLMKLATALNTTIADLFFQKSV